MHLDQAFDELLSSELTRKHAAKSLPKEFAAELNQYQTAQVIDTSALLDYSRRTQHVETELEHVVKAFKRPSLLFKNGQIESCASEHWRDIIERCRFVINKAAESVGRIDLKNHGQLGWTGTGFLIDDDKIVTNRHVAYDFIEKDGNGFKWRTNSNTGKYIRGRIDFLEEYGNPHENEYDIEDIIYIAKDNEQDVAILKLGETPAVAPISLSPNLSEDMMIITVGYPWRDSRVEGKLEEIHKRIFNDIYDVKRGAPGKVVDVETNKFSHDCSTLGGNSGSACIDIETGEVVGIHYGGQFVKNVAVSSSYLQSLI